MASARIMLTLSLRIGVLPEIRLAYVASMVFLS